MSVRGRICKWTGAAAAALLVAAGAGAQKLPTPTPTLTPAPTPKPAPTATTLPASGCAGLAEAGLVGVPGPDVVAPPAPLADRTLRCPDRFTLDIGGRLPLCRLPGVAVVAGNPRAICHAALALGPIAPVAPRSRPTPGCPERTYTTLVALRGPNLGWNDVTVAVAPDTDVVLTTLAAAGEAVAPAEDPVVQGCFAGDCRLVRLVVGPRAPASLRIEARLGPRLATREITLRAWCAR